MKKTRWQVRDDRYGLAIYESHTASEALEAFLCDKARAAGPGELKIAQFGDGTAAVMWRGVEYQAYRALAV
jgi:hypothetical protein